MDLSRPRAAIVVTGSELLTGTIADANGPWLARRLTDLGFQVGQLRVVGDRPDDLLAALADVAADSALVVTSGGLGPTADDLTVECVARFAGLDLVLDEAMYAQIAAIVGGRSPALDAGARKQAMIPAGALPMPPVGTAPGLVLRGSGGPLIVVLVVLLRRGLWSLLPGAEGRDGAG